jgi:hypothetical protein
MTVLDSKSGSEILATTIAELAKSQNELKCAQRDLAKIQSRLGFLTVLVNEMIKRETDGTQNSDTQT